MIEAGFTKTAEQKKLLGRLAEDSGLKKVKASLVRLSGSSFELHVMEKKEAIKTFGSAFEKARKSKKIELIKCKAKSYGFSYPLKLHDEVFGYVVGCGLAERLPRKQLDLVCCAVETAERSLRKEIKLEELYKTVKPRAIALSTVHTVHRLISSSLYLEELLPRIARLSMQIIDANRCSIKLIDSKKKTLLPKATVDLRTKKTKLKKVKIGRWAPGKAVKYGKSIKANQYLATPLIDETVIGVITLYDKVNSQPFNNFDVEIMRTLCEQAAIAIKNAQLYKEQEKLTMGSIKALAQIINAKGSGIYTPKSSFLRMVRLVGQEFKMREYDLRNLQYATLLHDAGELMVPEKLLKKKGRLTEKEYKLIKEHPLKGAKIIKSLKSIKQIAPIIMFHHENFDGTGYPKGLVGSEIPLGARIVAVVGAFEAMITKKPYRVPLSINRAIEEIKKNSRKQFDPKAVDAFLKVVKRKDVVSMIRKEI